MKLGKKGLTILSFSIGASIFVSTAFADSLIGSGYDRLKDTAKLTAAQMEKGLNNYTIEGLFSIKVGGQVIQQESIVRKIDTTKQASENSSVTQRGSDIHNSYSYTDNKYSIWKTNDKYFVTEFPNGSSGNKGNAFSNPFNEKGATEIEKIVDALVGNLKDYVQAEVRPEGDNVYSGSLSEAQVPAVVNAVTSFGMQQMISDQVRHNKSANMPEIESDIFVKKVTATAHESKTGILEQVKGDIVLSGKDKNGVAHEMTIDVAFKLSNVGSTTIAMPDITGENVEKVSYSNGFNSKHIGTYGNNIVIEKDGKFVKIGERTLEITSVDNGKVSGRFTETVKPGYEADYPNPYKFEFSHQADFTKPMSFFTYKNAKGEDENGDLRPGSPGKMYLNIGLEITGENSYRSNNQQNFDGEFIRIFAE